MCRNKKKRHGGKNPVRRRRYGRAGGRWKLFLSASQKCKMEKKNACAKSRRKRNIVRVRNPGEE